MADAGFSIPWPIVWSGGAGGGAGVSTITDNTIGTNDFSPHPINCMMAENSPLSKLTKVPSEWFGPGGPRVSTDSGISRGTYSPRLPTKWTR